MQNRQYDYEEDREEEEEAEAEQEKQEPQLQQLQQFEDDYNFAKLNADLNQLRIVTKANDYALRRMQKEIDCRVTESALTQTIALINSGIQTDPNIIKLLKTRENLTTDEQNDKIKINALAFSKKLNQISESLTVLMNNLKRVENKITVVQADLTAQMNEKYNSQQILIEETRGEQAKETMELQQKVELVSFEIQDKQREMETKLNWRLNEFKAKIDSKISEEMVLAYLAQTQKKVDKNMREYQLKSTIDPERIDKIEIAINNNRVTSENGVTECLHQLHIIRNQIDSDLVRKESFQSDKFKIEKRLQLFNSNFDDVYGRVIKCQNLQAEMAGNIDKLLKDAEFSLSEIQRINKVLINIKISQDFQRMLQEMNPSKVLQLQDKVQEVKQDQGNIFKEIALAKRQIQKVNAKTEIMGVMMPNKARDKLKKEEIQDALQQFLNDHQFTNKISSIDKQLHQYKLSVEAISLLNRQVARLQKESDTQKLAIEIQRLEENVKKELLILHNCIKDKMSFQDTGVGPTERPMSKGKSSISGDIMPLGEARGSRSFSLKKIQNFSSTNSNQGNSLIRQTIDAISIRKV